MNGEAWDTDHNALSVESRKLRDSFYSNGFMRIWSYLYVEPPDISPVCPLNVSVELSVFCERQDLHPRSQRAIGEVSCISTSFLSTAIL
jgi:hypothetical protein